METETINILIAISGLLIAVLLALIPYLRKVYFIGPELTIELIPNGGSSSPRGISSKNKVTDDGYIDGNQVIRIFELTWNINLKITNNSNITAYYPELKFLNKQLSFTTLEPLDKNKPIQSNEQILLKGKYKMFEECEGKDRTKIKGLPENFKNLKILLEYKNPFKKRFYTIYTNSDFKEKNYYTRNKPKEFK